MKTRTKKLLGVVGIVTTLGVLTSCNSFCSSKDSASFRYQHDPINTRFFNDELSAKEYAFSDIKKNNSQHENELILGTTGSTPLSAENVDQLKVDVFSTETKLEEKKSIIAKASEVFTIEDYTSTADDERFSATQVTYLNDNIIKGINEALDNTFIIRNGIVTVSYLEEVKTEKDGVETITTKNVSIINEFGKNNFVKNLEKNARQQGIATPVHQYWSDLDERVIREMIVKAYETGYFNRFQTITDESGKAVEGDLKGRTPKTLFELFYGFTNEAYDDYLAAAASGKTSKKDLEAKEKVLREGNKPYKLDETGTEVSFIGRNNSLFANYGFTKYVTDATEGDIEAATGSYWDKIETWNEDIRKEYVAVGSNYAMPTDFYKLYKGTMDQQSATLRTCISIYDGFYGHYGDDPLNNSIELTNKSSWGDAWKHGFLEGLFVYPIAYMVEYFAHAFGMNGWGQIGAVLLVTIIVRGLFMLATFKSTLSQQKMQTLQPEIAKLQQKYPNSDTNQYEKQRLAQAQMALYKKNKIHPFSSLLIIIIQFPVFISVWNGFSGAASLTSDAVLGLRLSDTIWSSLTNIAGWPGNPGWWTALVLILLMSAGQIISMQLPRWLQKKQVKNIARTSKNPAESAQQKQMKWVSWIMTGFIIIMGFTLPAAMGVYWFAGALFSMIQSGIMHGIMMSKKGNKGDKKLAFAGAKGKKDKKADEKPVDNVVIDEDGVMDFTKNENKPQQNNNKKHGKNKKKKH